MSKRGLPTGLQMRHDSHYVEELAKHRPQQIGRLIAIDKIDPNPEQPRTDIGDLTELTASISEKGVLEPLLVKPLRLTGRWMIIAGERRWRAATAAGLHEVPCIEMEVDDHTVAEIALIENMQRKDLTIWEEADGLLSLCERLVTRTKKSRARSVRAEPPSPKWFQLLPYLRMCARCAAAPASQRSLCCSNSCDSRMMNQCDDSRCRLLHRGLHAMMQGKLEGRKLGHE